MIVHMRRADLQLLVCMRLLRLRRIRLLLLRRLLHLLLVDDAALLVSKPAAGAATLATIAALRNSPGGDAGRAVQRRTTDVVRWAEAGGGDTVDAVAKGGRHGVRLDSAERKWATRKGGWKNTLHEHKKWWQTTQQHQHSAQNEAQQQQRRK